MLGIVLLAGNSASLARSCTRVWARGVLFLLRWVVGLDVSVIGQENIPSKPSLIISNHESAWETIFFLVLFPDVAIVTKQELLKIPIFGSFLRLSKMITIDRESGSKAIRKMVDEGLEALSDRRHILIFPQGTRGEPGAPVEFKRGVELLYAKLECDILPVAMNSGDFWRKGQPLRPGRIAVSCLPLIPGSLDAKDAIKTAETEVQLALNRIRAV
jgi:1-acyl-sn-glycerol-3-phosphate acyltransferase